jgi:ketosteroid isomerase-like protein
MHVGKGLICAITVALSVAAMPTVRADSGDEEAIRSLESKFAAAFNGKDVDTIMRMYIPGQNLFVFDVIPPRQYIGASAYRKDWEDLFATLKDVKFDITDLDIATDSTLAYSHSIQRLNGTDTKGQPFNLVVRVTDVYRKIDGNWLIVHEHVSVPVDLETGKPDLMSKP